MNATLNGLLFLGLGTLLMTGAALDWAIVSRPGKLLNRILGDAAARAVYFIAGLFLFVVGIGRLIGADWF